jgi:ectoine hydroxylase-related dioxygenase (phytanoyl-CoA dioxygenase family)
MRSSARRAGPDPADRTIKPALATYAEWGLGLVRGLFEPREIPALAAEADRLLAAATEGDRYCYDRLPDNRRVVERIRPVADLSPAFAALKEDARLTGLAAAALGEPATVLADTLLIKWPGTGDRAAHRNGARLTAAGVPATDIVTVLLALDPLTVTHGTPEFFPGLRQVAPPVTADSKLRVASRTLDDEWSLMPALAAGDVTLFDALLPHRTGVNGGRSVRRLFALSFAPMRYAGLRCLESGAVKG